MNQKKLTLENLKDLDFGKIGAAFQAELDHTVHDCCDRPTDKRPRKVAIVFSLMPKVDVVAGQVTADEILVGCEISSVVPKRRTQVYSMKPKSDHSLVFHPELPEDAEGSTLYDEDQIENDR